MTTAILMRILLMCGANQECIEQMEKCVRVVEVSPWTMKKSDDITVRGKIAFAICKRDYEKFTQE